MAGEIQVNSVTALTESGSNIVLNNVDTATNRTNLGLGSMATQDANAVALTGGSLTGTELDLKSSGTSVYKSDGTTSVISESSGTVTINNATLGSSVVFPAIGQLAFWHGYAAASSSHTFTLDGTNSYTVLVTGRHTSSPLYTKNLTFIIDSATGTVTSKTDPWGTALNESYDTSTNVLTLSTDSSTELMQILIFKGAITEGT